MRLICIGVAGLMAAGDGQVQAVQVRHTRPVATTTNSQHASEGPPSPL